jgi:hypothetical protein
MERRFQRGGASFFKPIPLSQVDCLSGVHKARMFNHHPACPAVSSAQLTTLPSRPTHCNGSRLLVFIVEVRSRRHQPSSSKKIQLLSPNPNQLVGFSRKANSKECAHDERCDSQSAAALRASVFELRRVRSEASPPRQPQDGAASPLERRLRTARPYRRQS